MREEITTTREAEFYKRSSSSWQNRSPLTLNYFREVFSHHIFFCYVFSLFLQIHFVEFFFLLIPEVGDKVDVNNLVEAFVQSRLLVTGSRREKEKNGFMSEGQKKNCVPENIVLIFKTLHKTNNLSEASNTNAKKN